MSVQPVDRAKYPLTAEWLTIGHGDGQHKVGTEDDPMLYVSVVFLKVVTTLLTGAELDRRTRETGYLKAMEVALKELRATEEAQDEQEPREESTTSRLQVTMRKLARAVSK